MISAESARCSTFELSNCTSRSLLLQRGFTGHQPTEYITFEVRVYESGAAFKFGEQVLEVYAR